MNEATEDFACVRCGQEVVAERQDMHWVCFHYEFEHEGDPDVPVFGPSCSANALIETDLMAIDRREEVVEVGSGSRTRSRWPLDTSSLLRPEFGNRAPSMNPSWGPHGVFASAWRGDRK